MDWILTVSCPTSGAPSATTLEQQGAWLVGRSIRWSPDGSPLTERCSIWWSGKESLPRRTLKWTCWSDRRTSSERGLSVNERLSEKRSPPPVTAPGDLSATWKSLQTEDGRRREFSLMNPPNSEESCPPLTSSLLSAFFGKWVPEWTFHNLRVRVLLQKQTKVCSCWQTYYRLIMHIRLFLGFSHIFIIWPFLSVQTFHFLSEVWATFFYTIYLDLNVINYYFKKPKCNFI